MLVWHLRCRRRRRVVVIVGGVVGGAAAWSSWSSFLFSNLALCSLRRPTTLIATFDTLLKNVEETKILTTERKVRGWYEKSVV